MAMFSKNTLTQVSGFDNPIITGELVYQQKTYWNITLTGSTGAPVDLTGASISAQIVRRTLSNVVDTRSGLSFDILPYTASTPSVLTLYTQNRLDSQGKFSLLIDDTSWITLNTDDELAINSNNGAGFSGRIKISFPATLTTPADDVIIFLLFLIRSDGVYKV